MAGFALGVIPVLKHGGIRLAESLRTGGHNASVGRERSIAPYVDSGPGRFGAGSTHRLRPDDPYVSVDAPRASGLQQSDGLQTLRISIPRTAAPNYADLLQMQHKLVNSLAGIPSVSEVSILGGLPMTGVMSQDPIFAGDHAYAAN